MTTFDAQAHKKNITLLRTYAEDCDPEEDYTKSVLWSLYNQFARGVYGFFGEARALEAAALEDEAAACSNCSERQRQLCLACAATLKQLATKLHAED